MLLALVGFVGVCMMVAVGALLSTRRLSRKVEELSHSYWELRYDFTRLRSQVARLDPEQQAAASLEPSPPATAVSFVPLSSLRPGQPKNG